MVVRSARAVLLDGGGRTIMVRAGAITPYDAQLIAEDAIGIRRAVELRVVLPRDTPDVEVAETEQRFSRLTALGIRVSVSFEDDDNAGPDVAAEKSRGDHPLVIDVRALLLARELLHELQIERALVTVVLARRLPAGELAGQVARTGRAVAEVDAFLASHRSLDDLTLVHLAAASALAEQLASVRPSPARPERDPGAVIDRYSRVDARLLDAIVAVASRVQQGALARSLAAYVAFACAKEEVALEAAELACAVATGSFDAGHGLALTVLVAAERSCLALFTATASPDILAAYRARTADSVFDAVTAFERMASERRREDFSGEGSGWLAAFTTKLDRLKEIGDVQSRAIIACAAAIAQ